MIEASTAPAPSVTKSAGKAQHRSVDNEANKLKVGRMVFLSIGAPVNLNHVVA